MSASGLRAILSRGSNPMLSSQDVDEISSFDANGDSELSVHEFAKACLSLSDEEAEALQAKLEEADAQKDAGGTQHAGSASSWLPDVYKES